MPQTPPAHRLDWEVGAGDARTGTAIRLPDGASIVIRPLREGDTGALASAYARLGARSRHRRFGAAPDRLPAGDLHRLAAVDHDCHEALVALDPCSRAIVGVARYIRLSGQPHDAEIAEEVVDDWQHRGVGTQLLAALEKRARAAGIERFHAVVYRENTPVRAALARAGAIAHGAEDETDYVVDLAEIRNPSPTGASG